MGFDQNKRKFPRADYPCFLTIWQGKRFDTLTAHTVNVGAGGLLAHLDQGLMIGAKAEIKIDFSKENSFECTGLVLRCQQNQADLEAHKGAYSVAIGFEGLDEHKASYLRELIEKLLTSENNN